jgi:hypothetical protein
MKPPP